MKIYQCSITDMVKITPSPRWSVISITDAGTNLVLSRKWHTVLYVSFPDSDIEEHLATFLRRHIHNLMHDERVEGIIIHCMAGISRSGGVARYIIDKYGAKRIGGAPTVYNRQVYSALMEL